MKRSVGLQVVDKMKNDLAKMLAKWLYRDFGILIEAPSEDQIAKTLEEHEERKETSKT